MGTARKQEERICNVIILTHKVSHNLARAVTLTTKRPVSIKNSTSVLSLYRKNTSIFYEKFNYQTN
jgi:hypothetical protein